MLCFSKNSNSLGVNLSAELSKRKKRKRQWRIKLNVKMYINGFIRANRVTVWEQKCWIGFWGDCRNLVSLHCPCPAFNPARQLYSAMLGWGMREEGIFFSNLFYLLFFFFLLFPTLLNFLSGASPLCLPQPCLAAVRLRAAMPWAMHNLSPGNLAPCLLGPNFKAYPY